MEASSLYLLLQEIDSVRVQIEALKLQKFALKLDRINSLNVRLKSLLGRLEKFGCKYNIVRVECIVDGEKLVLHFSSITPEDAILITKWILKKTPTEITSFEVPPGKPIKLV